MTGYDRDWLLDLDMGPDPLAQLEPMISFLDLRRGQAVLDLGCGLGATSVYLARECRVEVVAVDLWTDPASLDTVLHKAGVTRSVHAVRADARRLPFGESTFDAVVCIDAWEYFGTDVHFLPSLVPLIRKGGRLAVTTPSLRLDPYEQDAPPAVTRLVGWEASAWHSPAWWRRHWELSGLLTGVEAIMQAGAHQTWLDWSRALGEPSAAVTAMLEDVGADALGFAQLTAVRA